MTTLDFQHFPQADRYQIRLVEQSRSVALQEAKWEKFSSAYTTAKQLGSGYASQTHFADVIDIGIPGDLPDHRQESYDHALRAFAPWKKGPYRLFGRNIDAEWRSDLKWNRILEHLPPLEDKIVCDVGCHNGYFMFRALAHKPRYLLGMEPVPRHWFHFHFIYQAIKNPEWDARLHFSLLGIEHMNHFPKSFDVVLCLGILYHHTDPVQYLRHMRASLRPGGIAVIECQGIPGNEPVCLVPERRYMQARGQWFLPTETALKHWIQRSGFSSADAFYNAPLSAEEQRRTTWAEVDSFSEYNQDGKTIEGYPSPHRIYFLAKA